MPNHSLVALPPAADEWTTPADRQRAARQAYRQSVADGRPLTGVELGKTFGLSARWGTSRIAEVRAEDIGRGGRRHADDHDGATPNGTVRGRRSAADRMRVPVGNNGDAGHSTSGCAVALPQRNGCQDADLAVPIGNDCDELSSPNGTPGELRHAAGSAPAADASTTAEQATEPLRMPERRSRSLLDTTITLLVAAVAFAASYGHMLEVALMAGEHPWIAGAFPITVDGLVLAALRRGEEGRGWLALGAAASIAANVLAQFPEQAAAAGPIVSAWPPLALYGTHRLLHGCRRTQPGGDGDQAEARHHDRAVES